jgi:hypothetical protein
MRGGWQTKNPALAGKAGFSLLSELRWAQF